MVSSLNNFGIQQFLFLKMMLDGSKVDSWKFPVNCTPVIIKLMIWTFYWKHHRICSKSFFMVTLISIQMVPLHALVMPNFIDWSVLVICITRRHNHIFSRIFILTGDFKCNVCRNFHIDFVPSRVPTHIRACKPGPSCSKREYAIHRINRYPVDEC